MSGNDWHGKYDDGDWSEPKQAIPDSELLHQLLDSRVPKTEREHAAARRLFYLADTVENLVKVMFVCEHILRAEGCIRTADMASAAIAKAKG
jgi:hypothetical protein